MKKFKMMALTGILLSSTILGANTTVIQAAGNSDTNSNKAITVDKSAITKVINVVNELLGSSTTANKVNPQLQFSDLTDGSDQTVTPIFGKKTASEFASALQSELNVVDTDGQLVPMTVTASDSNTGFAKKVSYTLDGTTKTVNVGYSLAKPTVTFGAGQVMSFNSTDGIDKINATLADKVTATTKNGDDANGHTNSASVAFDKLTSLSNSSVKFTPSDLYGNGIAANGAVNVYTMPTTVPDRTVASDDVANSAYVFTSNGQRFLATPTENVAGSTDAVKYTVDAIDNSGNIIKDSSTGNPIEATGVTGKVTVNTNTDATDSTVTYTMVFKDVNSKQVVLTKDATGKYGATVDNTTATTALDGTGYVVSGTQSTTLGADTTEIDFNVTKTANTTINYINLTTGLSLNKPETLDGNNGDTKVLQSIPTGYKLNNYNDLLQTLSDAQPSKDVYVTPIKSVVKNLSYTVTFRDKDTGKVVGTSNNQGNLGDYIGLTAPDGYDFATIADHGFLLLKDNQNVTKYVKAANVPYSISYVDQDTNKEVGTQSGKGADGSEVTLKAPDDYAFVNADDVTYTIDKSDTATKTVYVKKSNQTVDNIVAGYPKNGYIKIYDGNGKLNDDVVLSEGSSWIIDQTKSINGVEYYRVATNEYVKASDVYKYVPLQGIVTTKGTNVTPVYNSRGQLVINLALDTNTPWYTDRNATIKGSEMYRVATDQWVKASDVTLNK